MDGGGECQPRPHEEKKWQHKINIYLVAVNILLSTASECGTCRMGGIHQFTTISLSLAFSYSTATQHVVDLVKSSEECEEWLKNSFVKR